MKYDRQLGVEITNRRDKQWMKQRGQNNLGARDQTGALSDADGRLQFVARQHPDADAGVPQQLQRGLDVFLQSTSAGRR